MNPILPSLALALIASTASPVTAAPPQQAQAAATADVERAVADRFCLRETGSLVTAQRNARVARADRANRDAAARPDCVAASGRSYSREDLDRTGSVDTAEALRRLDPAIR